MDAHKKPDHWSLRKWNTACKIIEIIAARNIGCDCQRDLCWSLREIASLADLEPRTVAHYVSAMCELRIIGRRILFSKNGKPYGAAMWVIDPSKQVDSRMIKRSRRVAEVEPQIRQALREDRESLRSVASRFGVSADTVQEMRRAIAPYDADTATVRRCHSCGAKITSHACLRCSLM